MRLDEKLERQMVRILQLLFDGKISDAERAIAVPHKFRPSQEEKQQTLDGRGPQPRRAEPVKGDRSPFQIR
jgi:hypothetical protein